jgi:hypothetical protein
MQAAMPPHITAATWILAATGSSRKVNEEL